MKNEVIAVLADSNQKNNLKFQRIFDFYRNHKDKNITLERNFNRLGFTEANFRSLVYEVKKLYKITDLEIKNFKPVGIKPLNPETTKKLTATNQEDKIEPLEIINTFNLESIEEKKPSIPEISLAELKANEVKFKDEFPFLYKEDCPLELKALVTDKFAAYYAFKEAHEALGEINDNNAADLEKVAELAQKAVESFQTDQLIYDELVHYRDKGEILGNHPVLEAYKKQNEIDSKSFAEIIKRKGLLENYINRAKKSLENHKTEEKKRKTNTKIDEWSKELVLINKKINDQK